MKIHACLMKFILSHCIAYAGSDMLFKENQETTSQPENCGDLLAFELFPKLARHSLSFLLVTQGGSPGREPKPIAGPGPVA